MCGITVLPGPATVPMPMALLGLVSATLQLGYSSAVDHNDYAEPAYITPPGQGSAGKWPCKT